MLRFKVWKKQQQYKNWEKENICNKEQLAKSLIHILLLTGTSTNTIITPFPFLHKSNPIILLTLMFNINLTNQVLHQTQTTSKQIHFACTTAVSLLFPTSHRKAPNSVFNIHTLIKHPKNSRTLADESRPKGDGRHDSPVGVATTTNCTSGRLQRLGGVVKNEVIRAQTDTLCWGQEDK